MAKSERLERMPGFSADASLYKTSVTERRRVDDAKKMAEEAVLQATHWVCLPDHTGPFPSCKWYNTQSGSWDGACDCGPVVWVQ